MNDSSEVNTGRGQKVKVRYETSDVAFVSQFLVNRSAEEIIVNCSPGYLPDPQGDGSLMPINQRIALTLPGARRLAETLLKALAEHDKQVTTASPASGTARLPRVD